MKKTVTLALLFLLTATGLTLLFSCGGGGGEKGGSVTPPAENITGTYSLQYYYAGHFDCGSGSTFFELSDEAQLFCDMGFSTCDSTGCDWSVMFERDSVNSPAFSGTLVVLDSTLHEAITFSGNSNAKAFSYSVTYTVPTTEGVMIYNDPTESDPAFICSGNMLSLFSTREFFLGTTQKLLRQVDWIKFSD